MRREPQRYTFNYAMGEKEKHVTPCTRFNPLLFVGFGTFAVVLGACYAKQAPPVQVSRADGANSDSVSAKQRPQEVSYHLLDARSSRIVSVIRTPHKIENGSTIWIGPDGWTVRNQRFHASRTKRSDCGGNVPVDTLPLGVPPPPGEGLEVVQANVPCYDINWITLVVDHAQTD